MINIVNSIANKTTDLIIRKKIAEYTEETQFYIKVSSLKEINSAIDILFIDLDSYIKYKEILEEFPNIKTILVLQEDEMIIPELLNNFNLFYINLKRLDNQLYVLLNRILEEIKIQNIIVSIPNKGNKKIAIKELNYIEINHRNLGYNMINSNIILGKTIRTSFAKEVAEYMVHDELYLIKPSFLVNLSNIDELYPDHIVFQSGTRLYLPKTAYKPLKKKWKSFYSKEE